MYNLLIVDDEYVERKGIALLLNKFRIPVNILEATNGRQALEILNSHMVRIVITDIRMPVMDGLLLAQTIGLEYPDIKVIIYSAFGEFEYARQAMKAGVTNYLLKPIEVQEFKEMITSIIEKCEQEDSRKKAQDQIADVLENFQQQHFLQMLLKPSGEEVDAAMAWYQQYAPEFPAYLLFVQSRGNFIEAREAELRTMFEKNIPIPHVYLNLTSSECICFLYPGKRMSDAQIADMAEVLCEKVRRQYGEHLFFIVSQMIGELSEIPIQYKSLEDMGDYIFFMQEGCVLLSRNGFMMRKNGALLQNDLLNCVYEDAVYGDFDKLRKDLMVLIQSIQNTTGLSHLYVKNIFLTLFSKLRDSAVYLPEGELHTIFKEITEGESLDWLLTYVDQQLMRLEKLTAKNSADSDYKQNGVQQAVKIIHQKYSDPSLSLEYLAEQVYLSPNYLSSLFKRMTGYSINKYICKYRLEKAEQLLLTTNLRVSDIGVTVGFSSGSYFVTVYGNHYGQSPSKYRETRSLKGIGGVDAHEPDL